MFLNIKNTNGIQYVLFYKLAISVTLIIFVIRFIIRQLSHCVLNEYNFMYVPLWASVSKQEMVLLYAFFAANEIVLTIGNITWTVRRIIQHRF